MQMRSLHLAVLSLCMLGGDAAAANIVLGTAESFSVLAGSTVTNTGATNLHGDLGLAPGTSVTGFPPGILSGGTIHVADAIALQAQTDLTAAYNFGASQPCGNVLTGQNLGGLTLNPGVYCFASSAQLTGTLTLNGRGDPNAEFLFQMGSTLTTASNSSVVFANGLLSESVFWQVGSSATLGTTTAFAGSILALSSITMNTGANIQCGRALARNGAVTLDTNDVSALGCAAVVIPPVDPPVIPPVDPPVTPPVIPPVVPPLIPPVIPPVIVIPPIIPPVILPTDPIPSVIGPGVGAAAIPEPGTVTLLGMGLLFALILFRRRVG